MTFYQNDIMNRHCTFAEDGTLLELQEENTPWLSGDLPASVKYVRDEKALQDIKQFDCFPGQRESGNEPDDRPHEC